MQFSAGDRVATIHAVGIFESGQRGEIVDVMGGDVLFKTRGGERQWLPARHFVKVDSEEDIGEFNLTIVVVVVGAAVMVAAAVLATIHHFCS